MQVESTIAAAVRLYSTTWASSGVLSAYVDAWTTGLEGKAGREPCHVTHRTPAPIRTFFSGQSTTTDRPTRFEMAGGHLKIFFGYAAGVGKTYAMLLAAHAAKRRGVDVVAGYIEPHERPATAHLARGLRTCACKLIEHNGIALGEFDLDAAIERAPQLILVDELAHTNAPGCSPRQTLSRRRGASTCGHRRLYDRERSAYREPERHGCIHHRRCRERANPRPHLR